MTFPLLSMRQGAKHEADAGQVGSCLLRLVGRRHKALGAGGVRSIVPKKFDIMREI